MKIAQIAPPWFAVPPLDYGGVELIVSLLADGLSTQGHDVTLFASAGSQTTAELVTPLEDPPDPSLLGNMWFDAFHALSAYLEADRFDVVHDHSGIVGPALGALLAGSPPVVHIARRVDRALAAVLHAAAGSPASRHDQHDATR